MVVILNLIYQCHQLNFIIKLKYNLRMTDEKLKAFRLMAKNLRSAKYSLKDMSKEFRANPEFKEWYFQNYIGLEKWRSI